MSARSTPPHPALPLGSRFLSLSLFFVLSVNLLLIYEWMIVYSLKTLVTPGAFSEVRVMMSEPIYLT